ncbi:MAG: ankyrin repeat domain-containing protein [Rickettsiella sp.]|nr:ankyrin repeat domain-containing protein [Rickettsiella sp.]
MDGLTTNIDSQKDALFQAAEFGNVRLIHYLLNKGLDIDSQDEGGDTLLHHAAKWGHGILVDYLLKRQASAFIKNQKGRTALLESYANNHSNISKKITKNIIEKNSIKSLSQFCAKKLENNEQIKINSFINGCKDHIKNNYLNRGIFNRLMARHNGRAKALIQALDRCHTIKEAKGLIKNQCELFEKGQAVKVSSELLASRWSTTLKNKPNNVSKSSFYKVLSSMPVQQRSSGFIGSQRQINAIPKQLSIRMLISSRA